MAARSSRCSPSGASARTESRHRGRLRARRQRSGAAHPQAAPRHQHRREGRPRQSALQGRQALRPGHQRRLPLLHEAPAPRQRCPRPPQRRTSSAASHSGGVRRFYPRQASDRPSGWFSSGLRPGPPFLGTAGCVSGAFVGPEPRVATACASLAGSERDSPPNKCVVHPQRRQRLRGRQTAPYNPKPLPSGARIAPGRGASGHVGNLG